MYKKAQAAMEFLMTYGWAILVVLVAIGALAYFGVLSPDRFLPERCTGPSGMDCLDKAAINDTHVSVVLKNNLGYTISAFSVQTGSEDCNAFRTLQTQYYYENASGGWNNTVTAPVGSGIPFNIPNGRRIRFNADCTLVDDGRFKTDLTIAYTNQETGLAHEGIISVTGIN